MSLGVTLNDQPLRTREVGGLIILLTAAAVPHAGNIGSGLIAFFLIAAAWRLAALWRPVLLPGKWLLALLMIIGIGLVMSNISLRDGRLSGTALLVVMLGLKLLELRSQRDIYVSLYLGFFLILTQFLFNSGLGLAIYLFALSVLLVGLLVSINRCRFDTRASLGMAGLQLLVTVPITAIFFVFFPRLDAPLWATPLHDSAGRTGISGFMRFGDIGRLSQSDALAFRARFTGAPPLTPHLYWRGPVLWRFDGRTWTPGRPLPKQTQVKVQVDPDTRADYEITLEPSGQRWVFALDIPTTFPPDLELTSDLQLLSRQRLEQRALYRLSSHTGYRLDTLSTAQRQQGLQLPDVIGERTRELARGWREQHPRDDGAVINEALRFFNRETFIYTLSPGTGNGDPIEDFLFERRRGFCEHYAGSFTLLMRLAGIPARVVTGYQGGTPNPLGNSLSVYQADAHAWSEVWLGDRGWVRIDPTAAVAPERVERSIDINRSGRAGRVIFDSGESNWLHMAARGGLLLVDAIELNWNRWVLGFNPERQQDLMKSLGLASMGHYAPAVALGALLSLLLLVSLVLLRRHARDPNSDPLHRIWQRYRRKLNRAGLQSPAWEGPEQLLQRAAKRWPAQADRLHDITHRYVLLRYGRLDGDRQRQALKRGIRRLRFR